MEDPGPELLQPLEYRHKLALRQFHLSDKAITLKCAVQSTEITVSFFNTFRSKTKVLAYINLIRLEYCIINRFLMMFLIKN